MRRNADRFVLLCVLFCLWHFQPPHVSFAQAPRQPKLLEQKLSEVSSDKVSDWVKVQIEDLGYASDIAESQRRLARLCLVLQGRFWWGCLVVICFRSWEAQPLMAILKEHPRARSELVHSSCSSTTTTTTTFLVKVICSFLHLFDAFKNK